MVSLLSDKEHFSGIINKDGANIGKNTVQGTKEWGDNQQVGIPTGNTRKVWVPPTVEEIEIDMWDEEWWLDDLSRTELVVRNKFVRCEYE
jgi:hypothetical protein